ncbi:MAG: hypothetical protein IBX58_11910 [Roseovarius sp.]|nr:hypothetical protein [Roseovarius sp.]
MLKPHFKANRTRDAPAAAMNPTGLCPDWMTGNQGKFGPVSKSFCGIVVATGSNLSNRGDCPNAGANAILPRDNAESRPKGRLSKSFGELEPKDQFCA